MYRLLFFASLICLFAYLLLGCEGAGPDRTITRTIESEEGIYEGEIKNGLPHGEGHFEYYGFGSYTGGFYEGEFHGFGVFDVPGLFRYEGEYYHGQYQGYGVETSADGSSYEGEWYQGEKHGEGTKIWADGTSYTGNFNDGYRDGQGLYTWLDGRTYEGEFTQNIITGYGTMAFPEGMSFSGNWEDGLMNGEGQWIYESGATYSGLFEEGELVEEGKWLIDGSEYDEYFSGEYRGGLPYGEGKRYYTNGGKAIGAWDSEGTATGHIFSFESDGFFYEGEMRAGFFDGLGREYSLLRDYYYEGEFSAGLREGQGSYYHEGNQYEGEWHDDLPHGFGTQTEQDGTVYEGEWQAGNREGHGRLTYESGRVYEGGWKEGLQHGEGTILDRDGNIIYLGLWENGSHVSGASPDSAADYYIDYAEGTIPLSEVEVGSRIVDSTWQWEYRTGRLYQYETGDITMPVTWIVVAHDHYDSGEGHVTLLAAELIALFSFDSSTDRGDSFGSNNWADSGTTNASHGLRPWLNSSGIHSDEGFYQAFSAEFKEALVISTVPNKGWEDGEPYTTEDKVFVPASAELGDTIFDRTHEIGRAYPYFQDAADEDRVAMLFGEPQSYWLRSPSTSFSEIVQTIGDEGAFSWMTAHIQAIGVRPVVNIKSDVMVSRFSD